MTRYQARFVVGVAIISLLGGVGYYLGINLWVQQQSDQALQKLAADLAAKEEDQRMQDFRRVKMRDGKKVWEIAARQARYFEDRSEVVVDDPEVSLYVRDGNVIALRCREGRIQLDAGAQQLVRMELHGDLEIQMGDFSLRTQEAVYERKHDTISSAGLVQIVGRGLTVEGRGYTVAVNDKRVTLNAEVRTTVVKEAS